METLSVTIELAGFQWDGVFHIKARAFACPKTRSSGSHVFDSTRIVPDSAAVLWGLLTKWSIMAFCSIRQAYHPPLLVWFYKPLFKTLCLIGWRGETPLLPKSSCEPKVSKRSIFADLLNNIHFRCSAATYRTKRTFSLLHLHSSVQPPTPGQSVRKLSDLPTGLPSKV